MKLPAFEYHRPASVDEAVALLASLDDAKVLAGGQSLVPLLALRMGSPANLVDVTGVGELRSIADDGTWLRVGAGVRQAELERWPGLAQRVPLLAAALPNIGHRPIRNRGTVCGSLAHADPAAELPAAAVALDAQLELAGPTGRRTVAAADFFQGYLTTAIGDDELLVEARFPIAPSGQGAAVVETSRRHGDFALVGAAATVTIGGGVVASAALVVFGAGPVPVRLTEVEDAVIGADPASPDAFVAAGEIARRSVSPSADDHGSTAYKQQLAAVSTRRCLAEAARRAGGAS